jgi:hypothetical protein
MSYENGTRILAFIVQEQKCKNCISYILALLAAYVYIWNFQEELTFKWINMK